MGKGDDYKYLNVTLALQQLRERAMQHRQHGNQFPPDSTEKACYDSQARECEWFIKRLEGWLK